MFQSSFELTGYITDKEGWIVGWIDEFQSSFELTGYITIKNVALCVACVVFQSSFELTGYITCARNRELTMGIYGFKALSSLRVI